MMRRGTLLSAPDPRWSVPVSCTLAGFDRLNWIDEIDTARAVYNQFPITEPLRVPIIGDVIVMGNDTY